MTFGTIIFGLVFVIPLIIFITSIVWKDKRTRGIGTGVIVVLVIFAVVVAYFVNKDK